MKRPNVLCFTLLLLTNPVAQADVILNVPDLTIVANGTGFVDVLVSTTGGDTLTFFNYEFELTAVGGATSSLQITGIEGGAIGNIFPNYVFAAGTMNDGQEVDASTPLPGATFIAGDGLDLGDPAVTATNALLTRINFQHAAGPGGAAGAVGDQFNLTLLNDGDTFFEDDGTIGTLTLGAASLNPGTITISSAAVPEPSTFGMGTLVIASACLAWRRRQQLASSENT